MGQPYRLIGAALSCLLTMAMPLSAYGEAPEVIVYNAQHENLTRAWADAFAAETGIHVLLRQGSDLELGNQIVQEGEYSLADVFLTENSPAMELVDKAGLFEPLPQDILDQVAPAYRPGDGHWTGVAARSTVFAYNKTKLRQDQLPKSVMNLADPSWKGRWAASPSGADFQAIVAAILAQKGEQATLDWLKAMKGNATSYRGNRAAMAGVNRGEVDGALVYHYYYYGDQANTKESSGNVALHYFRNGDPGAFVSVSGAGLLRTSKHREIALQFLKWITGPKGQAILRDGDSFEYAVGLGQASHPALVPLTELDAPSVDPASLDNAKVTELMTAAGLL